MDASSKTVNKVIACCSCGGISDKSKAGFKLLFPDDELPEMVIGREKITDYSEKFYFDSQGARRLRALSKDYEKFSNYFEIDNDGTVVKQYDLLNGRRIQ